VELVERVDERPQGSLRLLTLPGDKFAAPLPCRQHRKRRDADQQRELRTVNQFRQVGGEEKKIDQQQGSTAEDHQPQRGAPLGSDDIEEQT
jgi:hypothetical protein